MEDYQVCSYVDNDPYATSENLVAHQSAVSCALMQQEHRLKNAIKSRAMCPLASKWLRGSCARNIVEIFDALQPVHGRRVHP
jgi:hypothetical protein